MKKTALALLLFASCNRTDPAKEKELAELRARVSQLEGKSSMSAVEKAAPAIVPGGLPPLSKTEAKANKATFERNLLGQLDRIDAEEHAIYAQFTREAPRPELPTEEQDNKALGLDSVLSSQPRADDIIAFADKAAGTRTSYLLLQKDASWWAGSPWKFSARIIEITEKRDPALTTARVALDYFGRQIVFVAGRFNTNFVVGNTVDTAISTSTASWS
jgi:hypothetical protein